MKTAEELTVMLRATRTHYRKVRSLFDRGASTKEALSTVPASDLRQALTEKLSEIDAARHRVRRATIATGMQEGMSIGELGRIWGFSRQLAARYAKEARATS